MKNEEEDIKNCSVCLNFTYNLISTVELDSNNILYSLKLTFCVPEVEWSEEFICLECASLLNQAYEFKHKCLKSRVVVTTQKNQQYQFPLIKNFNTDNEAVQSQHDDDNSSGNFESNNYEQTDQNLTNCNRSHNISTIISSQIPPPFAEYSCKTCNESFKERRLLALHNKKRHKKDRPYDCFFCDRHFKIYSDVNKHELIHLRQKNYTCDTCNQSFNTCSILSKHKTIKHTDPSEWKYSCPHCNKKYPFKSSTDAHIKRHHINAGNYYTCYHCAETYSSRILLISHIRRKHNLKQHRNTKTCNLCKKSYINQVMLENHMRKEHNLGTTTVKRRLKRYSCEKCGRRYTTERVLKLHITTCDGIKRHQGISTRKLGLNKKIDARPENESKNDLKDSTKKHKRIELNCELCNSFVGLYKKLAAHTLEEHGVDPKTIKPYHCDECNAKFSYSSHLARHKLYHAGNRSHMCSYCGKGFITKKDVVTHEKLHTNTRDIQCEICSKKFNTKTHLRTHKLVVHTDPSQWNHVCPFCGKRFPMKSNYDQHVRRHTGERPFACHLCEKRFSDKFVLQQHFNTHSNIRAFKCSQCDKEYKNYRVLNIHLKKVHGIGNAKIPVRIKKFFCEQCPKSFAAKDKLQRHMYSHTGERPFSCNICDKRFTDKWYVKQHLTVHNVIKNEPNECF